MTTFVRYLTFSIALCGLASASQAAIVLNATLSGAAEAPPNASAGFGTATLTFDDALQTMRLQATFSNLTGTVTAAHIHATTAVPLTGTAGVATQLPSFSAFPSGVTSGNYDNTFDMSLAASYNPAFVTANGGTTASAYAALRDASVASRSYLNIHTSAFGGGEIRGFFAVPEPSCLGLGMLLLGLTVRHRQRRSAE
ncbi:MAG: CHRD domain-containing protein [Planctomycetales bacterium]|nr:CHRD domain-containing protein [Planctomycetales bacterium]